MPFMPLRPTFRFRCFISALAAAHFAVTPAKADDLPTPRELIDWLNLEVRTILADPKTAKTPEEVERATAEQIAAFIRSDERNPALTAQDLWGRTPLMLAVSSGYPLIVETLLTAPVVRQDINVSDHAGETAWMLAQFVPSVTLVACQPATLTRNRAPLLPPYLRRMTQLLADRGAAPLAILKAVEAAGAEGSPEDAKRAWLARCPNAAPELRQALADGPLMKTLVSESIKRQAEFNRTAKANLQSLPAKPPADMKFFHGPLRGVRIARPGKPKANAVYCTMPTPAIPAVNWSGVMNAKFVINTRAGIVETVDAQTTVDPPNEAAADQMLAAMLRAVAGYRCEGDFAFEQEMQIKIE